MGSRTKNKGNYKSGYNIPVYAPPATSWGALDGRPGEVHKRRGRILTVSNVLMPIAWARRAKNKVYAYPLLNSIVPYSTKVRRFALMHSKGGKWVKTKVKILLPRRLPLASPSYVSLRNNRLNVHSRRQLMRALISGELNRRRYVERKSNRRRAANGQLSSHGALAGGLVSRAYHSGKGISQIADAALVARAMLGQEI